MYILVLSGQRDRTLCVDTENVPGEENEDEEGGDFDPVGPDEFDVVHSDSSDKTFALSSDDDVAGKHCFLLACQLYFVD